MFDVTSTGIIISLISAGMALLSTLVRNVVLGGREKIKEHKEKMTHHQTQMKEAQKKNDLNAMQHHQKEYMKISMNMMKPMWFTLIPFMIIFSWMSGTYGDVGNMHNVTVSDVMPAGSSFAKVDAGANGKYVGENHTIVWNWSKIIAETSGEVNVTLTSDKPVASDYKPGELVVDYTLHNGTTGHFSASEGFEGTGSILNAWRKEVRVEGNVVKYSIAYQNTDSNMVADLMGYRLGWFWWYFISSFVSSMIFNKVMGNT